MSEHLDDPNTWTIIIVDFESLCSVFEVLSSIDSDSVGLKNVSTIHDITNDFRLDMIPRDFLCKTKPTGNSFIKSHEKLRKLIFHATG